MMMYLQGVDSPAHHFSVCL